MYNQRYRPFSQTSDDGHWCLKVSFLRIEIEQHGEKYPVQEPWFTLEDTITKKIVWSRQGNWRIDDAHALFISDDGWSVIRFHGKSTYSRLLAISPEGNDVLTVGVSSFIKPYVTEPPIKEGKWELWIDEHVEHSTAGDSWSYRARFRFCEWSGGHLFVCRTEWGRYLVIDLKGGRVMDKQDDTTCALFTALEGEDEKWALKILRETRDCKDELEVALAAQREDESNTLPKRLAELWGHAFIALLIVRQNRIDAATQCLEGLQSLSDPGFGGFISVAPMKNFSSKFDESFREYVHLAMLRIGIRPKGYALMIFNKVGNWPCSEPHLLRLPECVENRESLIRSLMSGMKPREVVFRIGAPEFIRDSWLDDQTCPRGGEFVYECWDYDELAANGEIASWVLLWKKIDENSSELFSITRFIWSDAYRMMREEGSPLPISVAEERLAKAALKRHQGAIN